MRPLILFGLFGIFIYIDLSKSAPVLDKKDSHKFIANKRTVLQEMINQVRYHRDRILINQINSARHQAEDLFHEYVQSSTYLPDGYEIREREVLNLFPQVDSAVSQTFSLNSTAILLLQLTQSITNLRAVVGNTLTIQLSPMDGRLVDHLEQLVGQLNQILYRLPTTSNNLHALTVTNVDNDDQKRVITDCHKIFSGIFHKEFVRNYVQT